MNARHGLTIGGGSDTASIVGVVNREILISDSVVDSTGAGGVVGADMHGNCEYVRYQNCLLPHGAHIAGDHTSIYGCQLFSGTSVGEAVHATELVGLSHQIEGCTVVATRTISSVYGLINIGYGDAMGSIRRATGTLRLANLKLECNLNGGNAINVHHSNGGKLIPVTEGDTDISYSGYSQDTSSSLSPKPPVDRQIRVQIYAGGTIGTGATFKWSEDAGASWSAATAIGTSVALTGTGLTLAFHATASYATGHFYFLCFSYFNHVVIDGIDVSCTGTAVDNYVRVRAGDGLGFQTVAVSNVRSPLGVGVDLRGLNAEIVSVSDVAVYNVRGPGLLKQRNAIPIRTTECCNIESFTAVRSRSTGMSLEGESQLRSKIRVTNALSINNAQVRVPDSNVDSSMFLDGWLDASVEGCTFGDDQVSKTQTTFVAFRDVTKLTWGRNLNVGTFGTTPLTFSAPSVCSVWNASALFLPERRDADGWYQNAAAASQSNVPLTNPAYPGANATNKLVVTSPLTIVGVSVHSSAARTAGTLTVELYKNGAGTGRYATVDGTNPTVALLAVFPQIDTGVAGDTYDMRVTTSSDWAPTSANIRASFQYQFT
jgi:hypothetical protein